MADTKISELTELTSAANNDVLYIVDTDSTASKKITFNNLLKDVTTSVTFPNLVNEVQSLSTNFQNISSAVNSVSAYRSTEISILSDSVGELSANFEQVIFDNAVSGRDDIFINLSAAMIQGGSGGNGTFTLASVTTMTFLSGILIGTT
tara:strand:+ start:103 stop:549 length:447 start_codon:yes stop_codon:yes gene_type:complete